MSFVINSHLLCVVLALAAGTAIPEYNAKEARLYLQYARASFCTKEHVQNWDCGDMCHDAPVHGSIRFLQSKFYGAQGYVARISDARESSEVKCIAVFRGSISAQNWISDFMAWLTPWNSNSSWCPGCEAHDGVARTYASLRDEMIKAVRDFQCASVAFSGHSLGGSIVALASLDLHASLGLPVGPVYTYGMLRVGNPAFVDAYVRSAEERGVSPPMWRLVHYHDPVPRVPPILGGRLNYAHTPLEVYYTDRNSTQWELCPSQSASENRTCAAAVSIFSCLSHPGYDHNMYLNLTTDFDLLPTSCTSNKNLSTMRVFV